MEGLFYRNRAQQIQRKIEADKMKLLLIIPLLLVGCISAPDRLDYETETCFDAAYCRYLSAKSKFNLGCSKDADIVQ